MKFMFVFFFLISLIGFLRINLFFNFQSINSQGETIPALVNMSVKITSPSEEKQIPLGELTISGISSDTPNQNCIVFVDWNDLKPFQKVRAAGPGGINDFSEWIFTYDSSYHEIVVGNNELTSKITCLDGSKSLTKWNSINVTGYSQNSSSLPVVHKNTTSLASTSKQLPVQTILPGLNHNTTTISFEQNTTSFPLSNVSSVEENTTSFPMSNVSGSSVEMIIPNESTQNINNSISASPQSTSQLKSKQLTFHNPRIDLDEQRPATTIDDQSNNQTMAPPVIDNQTMAPPVVDNQTMAPPVIDNQTMAPPVVDNQTMAPPVVDNQTMAPPVEDNQTIAPQLQQQPPTLDNQQPPQLQQQPPTLDNQQPPQLQQQPPTLDNQQPPQLQQQPPTLDNQQPPQLPQLQQQPPTLDNQQPPQLQQQPPTLDNQQ